MSGRHGRSGSSHRRCSRRPSGPDVRRAGSGEEIDGSVALFAGSMAGRRLVSAERRVEFSAGGRRVDLDHTCLELVQGPVDSLQVVGEDGSRQTELGVVGHGERLVLPSSRVQSVASSSIWLSIRTAVCSMSLARVPNEVFAQSPRAAVAAPTASATVLPSPSGYSPTGSSGRAGFMLMPVAELVIHSPAIR